MARHDEETVSRSFITRWRRWAHGLKVQVYTLYYAYRNPRTPWYAKAWAAVVVGYALSPIDLIPDFIPVIGYLDDLILIPLGVALAFRLVPKPVLIESKRLAEQDLGSRRKRNWAAAAIIVLVWIAILAVVAYLVFRTLRKG